MTTCKQCGKEIEESEFATFFFENPEEISCSECKVNLVKKALENKEDYAINREEVF